MTEHQDSTSDLDSRKNPIKPLSQRRKIALALLFIIGIPLSYPSVLPLGVLCSAILLFQKNKKVVRLGFLLIIFQLLLSSMMMLSGY